MRFYNIEITPISGDKITYSSLGIGGLNNGSALKVELDLFESLYHQAAPNSMLRIYGVPYKNLGQLGDLNPKYDANPIKYAKIKISVGMSKGLPYAQPSQAGLIIDGIIEYAFANWQGAEICLDLIVNSNFGTPYLSTNISWNWKEGDKMQDAVILSLENAYKDSKPVFTGGFSDKLKFTETQPGIYLDIYSFSRYINKTSKAIIQDPNYIGATISPTPDGFSLDDGTTSSGNYFPIEYIDMIGNPTWKAAGIIQVKLTMRGDMALNDYISFPFLTNAVNNAFSTQQVRNQIPFQGYFQIQKLRHVGSSRQPTGDAWCTIVDAIVTNNIPDSILIPNAVIP